MRVLLSMTASEVALYSVQSNDARLPLWVAMAEDLMKRGRDERDGDMDQTSSSFSGAVNPCKIASNAWSLKSKVKYTFRTIGQAHAKAIHPK